MRPARPLFGAAIEWCPEDCQRRSFVAHGIADRKRNLERLCGDSDRLFAAKHVPIQCLCNSRIRTAANLLRSVSGAKWRISDARLP